MITLYGIPNCDTIRKARRWLEANGITYHFHDYRKDGISQKQIQAWADELGWENLLNRRGTTWRKLDTAERDNIDGQSAIRLMAEHPAIIKRPLLDTGTHRQLGFDESHYQQLLLS